MYGLHKKNSTNNTKKRSFVNTNTKAVTTNSLVAPIPIYNFIHGKNGKNGKDGSSIIVNSGIPTFSSGNDNDFYIDNASGNYYLKQNDWILKGNFANGIIKNNYGLFTTNIVNLTTTTSDNTLFYKFNIKHFNDMLVKNAFCVNLLCNITVGYVGNNLTVSSGVVESNIKISYINNAINTCDITFPSKILDVPLSSVNLSVSLDPNNSDLINLFVSGIDNLNIDWFGTIKTIVMPIKSYNTSKTYLKSATITLHRGGDLTSSNFSEFCVPCRIEFVITTNNNVFRIFSYIFMAGYLSDHNIVSVEWSYGDDLNADSFKSISINFIDNSQRALHMVTITDFTDTKCPSFTTYDSSINGWSYPDTIITPQIGSDNTSTICPF